MKNYSVEHLLDEVEVTPPDPQQPTLSTLRVNGRDYRIADDVRTTVLDALREQTGLTGTKKGCDHGQCGACTVYIDGTSMLSCLTLAVSVQDQEITTIEGLTNSDGELHPMQQAFIDQDAFQCGYCTAGQIMSAVACVEEGHTGSSAEIQEFMSGNLCRCAAYPHIIAAITQAKQFMKSAADQTMSQENPEEQNREIVRRAFDEWAQGGEQFFDILASDATWTIMGSGPSVRAYHGKQTYIDEVMKPLRERLSGPVIPHVRKLWADEDYVIVRWDQDAMAHDGKPYRNSYAWFFKMKDGKVIEVTAFLDIPAYDALITRVKPT